MNILNKLELEGNFLTYTMTSMNNQPLTSSLKVKYSIFNTCSLKWGIKQECPILSLLFNIAPEVLARAIRQKHDR